MHIPRGRIIAPIAQVDLWIMMYEDRQPLDLKASLEAHVELLVEGLFASPAA